MTPLEKIIGEIIAAEGPMPIDRYMGLCLGHPVHGYYMTRDPFGEQGDFMTAPEISQIFGELIGVWCAAAWDAMGKPEPFNLVELGPGRGTLMADILKAGKVMPGFGEAARIHLVEMSPGLAQAAEGKTWRRRLWHESIASFPMARCSSWPMNSSMPFPSGSSKSAMANGWSAAWGRKAWASCPPHLDNAQGANGEVIEFAPAALDIARDIGQRLARNKGCALIIDYGHLQTAPAIRCRRCGPMNMWPSPSGRARATSPPMWILRRLPRRSARAVRAVHPAITQGAFLLAMGLEQRAAILSPKADAHQGIWPRRCRLAGETEMGNLFKVMVATSPDLPTPYPFGTP